MQTILGVVLIETCYQGDALTEMALFDLLPFCVAVKQFVVIKESETVFGEVEQ